MCGVNMDQTGKMNPMDYFLMMNLVVLVAIYYYCCYYYYYYYYYADVDDCGCDDDDDCYEADHPESSPNIPHSLIQHKQPVSRIQLEQNKHNSVTVQWE
jgi:hypothetical protein